MPTRKKFSSKAKRKTQKVGGFLGFGSKTINNIQSIQFGSKRTQLSLVKELYKPKNINQKTKLKIPIVINNTNYNFNLKITINNNTLSIRVKNINEAQKNEQYISIFFKLPHYITQIISKINSLTENNYIALQQIGYIVFTTRNKKLKLYYKQFKITIPYDGRDKNYNYHYILIGVKKYDDSNDTFYSTVSAYNLKPPSDIYITPKNQHTNKSQRYPPQSSYV